MLKKEEVFVFPAKNSGDAFRTARSNVYKVMGFDDYFARITRLDPNARTDFGLYQVFEPYKVSTDTPVEVGSFNPRDFKPFECDPSAQKRNS
ncbi:hypothetical protein HYW44_04245 [Candidatus Daviesbacteria bacterium]|nr:hypothetical protein [Candidatus Daviesbacteria bacterium]